MRLTRWFLRPSRHMRRECIPPSRVLMRISVDLGQNQLQDRAQNGLLRPHLGPRTHTVLRRRRELALACTKLVSNTTSSPKPRCLPSSLPTGQTASGERCFKRCASPSLTSPSTAVTDLAPSLFSPQPFKQRSSQPLRLPPEPSPPQQCTSSTPRPASRRRMPHSKSVV